MDKTQETKKRTENKNEITIIDIDTVRNMDIIGKAIVLNERQKWLKRQRADDLNYSKRQERKVNRFLNRNYKLFTRQITIDRDYILKYICFVNLNIKKLDEGFYIETNYIYLK